MSTTYASIFPDEESCSRSPPRYLLPLLETWFLEGSRLRVFWATRMNKFKLKGGMPMCSWEILEKDRHYAWSTGRQLRELPQNKSSIFPELSAHIIWIIRHEPETWISTKSRFLVRWQNRLSFSWRLSRVKLPVLMNLTRRLKLSEHKKMSEHQDVSKDMKGVEECWYIGNGDSHLIVASLYSDI